MPRNKKIAEMFFYSGAIERWGSGIKKILDECAEAGLPEPDFETKQAALWVTFRKDALTEERLRELGLNERQIQAVGYLKEKGRITNRNYRQLAGLSDEGARQDLKDLVDRDILESKGSGRSAHYVLKRVGD